MNFKFDLRPNESYCCESEADRMRTDSLSCIFNPDQTSPSFFVKLLFLFQDSRGA
jgi:hypothetical protein